MGEEGSGLLRLPKADSKADFAQIYLIQRPVEGAPYSFNALTYIQPLNTHDYSCGCRPALLKERR